MDTKQILNGWACRYVTADMYKIAGEWHRDWDSTLYAFYKSQFANEINFADIDHEKLGQEIGKILLDLQPQLKQDEPVLRQIGALASEALRIKTLCTRIARDTTELVNLRVWDWEVTRFVQTITDK